MLKIFVNLKRFDVPRAAGGVCDVTPADAWIEAVIAESVALGLGASPTAEVVFFVPEALVVPAIAALERAAPERRAGIAVGCQGVHRDDVRPGGNFGAFTTNRPAAAMVAAGCGWVLVGHSEARRDKLGIIETYAAAAGAAVDADAAAAAVDRLLNQELLAALGAGLDVLACVGETAAERGEGTPKEQAERVRAVLARQVARLLDGAAAFAGERQIALAYEPVWAIGPGKVPPGPDVIGFAATCVKEAAAAVLGAAPAVVYGGGLKEENAAAICAAPSVDGGLVALTRFTPPIGFSPAELARIVAAATA
jgi:triosephosphate isomerase